MGPRASVVREAPSQFATAASGTRTRPATPMALPASQFRAPSSVHLARAASIPGETGSVGNEVHQCSEDGTPNGPLVETCDVNAGLTCDNGICKTACEIAADSPSNVGCQFWAVDLHQQDGFNDPASEPWGLAFSNTGIDNLVCRESSLNRSLDFSAAYAVCTKT